MPFFGNVFNLSDIKKSQWERTLENIKFIGQQRAKSQHGHIQSYSDLILHNALNLISKNSHRHIGTLTYTHKK